MIKHIVMFKLQENEKTENLETAKSMLASFEKEIPTLKKLEVVCNHKETPETNCDLALICDFEDIAGLNEYQKHPTHVAFGKFITQVRESRACIDYEY
ncbi:Dabb family protein [Konateibacter massiliensis]|uniref:Dabb family protein n=1 Tax=Konateibacter massiliensis TaxID=2002841 RepID=UPI000C15065B|nr:Dabb family protein [Konateibacter massiliensis]